jgi:hypothetical protein
LEIVVDDKQKRPFLAQQARTDLPETPESGRYDAQQQLQVAGDEAASPRVESPEATVVMTSSGVLRSRVTDGGDASDNPTDS